MSGHSQWHNIQKPRAPRTPGAAAFTKIAKEIIVAVKEGGGITDPANNSRLATVITKARPPICPTTTSSGCWRRPAAPAPATITRPSPTRVTAPAAWP